MPSISIPEAFVAVTVATNQGVLTVGSTTALYPGANAWVSKDDGSAQARVKILAILSTTTFKVRRYLNDYEYSSPPSYGTSDMSAFTGGGVHICQESQTVPVDPAYTLRVFP